MVHAGEKVFTAMGVEFDMGVASPGRDNVPWIPAKQHLTHAEDGLTTPWHGFVWCNPPYGNLSIIFFDIRAHARGLGSRYQRLARQLLASGGRFAAGNSRFA
jgi:hypothetical protein